MKPCLAGLFSYFVSMRVASALIGLFFFFQLFSCSKNSNDQEPLVFDSVPLSVPLSPLIEEISGITASKIFTDHLWVHEDSGTPSRIYLLKKDGVIQKPFVLKNLYNRDWEEMTLSGNELYLAETGDNYLVFPSYVIYRFPEPSMAIDTITAIDSIQFTYPDGSHDTEAMLVDEATKDIYLITKRDIPSKVYKLSYPYTPVMVASFVSALPYSSVTGAAVSADGNEILVRTYTDVYYYKRSAGQSIPQALAGAAAKLAHHPEPQGEAICFARNGSGYFTISEQAFATNVELRFYGRK